MTETATLNLIKEKIELVEAQGFGEVTIKIKNGAVWRVLNTCETYLGKPVCQVGLDKNET